MENLFDSPYSRNINETFCGREWIFKRVDEWLQDREKQFLFILGEPGSGKTSLAYRLKQFSEGSVPVPKEVRFINTDFLAVTYFCSSRNRLSLTTDTFVKSIIHQLSLAIPDFETVSQKRTFLRFQIDIRNQNITNCGNYTGAIVNLVHYASQATLDYFFESVIAPVNEIFKDTDKELVFLIDGLSECFHSEKEPGIAKLLFSSLEFPRYFRFIVTSHIDTKMDDEIKYGAAPYPTILLSEKGIYYTHCRNDIQIFIQDTVQREGIPLEESVRSSLVEKIAGNFLYAKYLLDMLLKSEKEITSAFVNSFPNNLDPLYRQYLSWLCKPHQDLWKRRLRPILKLLAVVHEPVTLTQIRQWLKWPEDKVRDTLLLINHLLTSSSSQSNAKPSYSLYHNSFRQFLLDEKKAGNYYCEPQSATQSIVDFYLKALRKNGFRIDRYGLKYLIPHLQELGQEDEIVGLLNKTYLAVKRDQIADTRGIVSDLLVGLSIAETRNDFGLFLKYCTLYDFFINNFPLMPADYILKARTEHYQEAIAQVEFLFDIDEILLVYAEAYLRCFPDQKDHSTRYLSYVSDHLSHCSYETANEIVQKIARQDPLASIKLADCYFDKRMPSLEEEPLFFHYGSYALYTIFKRFAVDNSEEAINRALQLEKPAQSLCALTAVISVLYPQNPDAAVDLRQNALNRTEDRVILLSRFRFLMHLSSRDSYVPLSPERLYLLLDWLPWIPLDFLLTQPFDRIILHQPELAHDVSQNHPNPKWRAYFTWRLHAVGKQDLFFSSTGDRLIDALLRIQREPFPHDSFFEMDYSLLTETTYAQFCAQLSVQHDSIPPDALHTVQTHLLSFLISTSAHPFHFVGSCYLLRLYKTMNRDNRKILLHWFQNYLHSEIEARPDAYLHPFIYRRLEEEVFIAMLFNTFQDWRVDSLKDLEPLMVDINDGKINYSLSFFIIRSLAQEQLVSFSHYFLEQEWLIRDIIQRGFQEEQELLEAIECFVNMGHLLLPYDQDQAKSFFKIPLFLLTRSEEIGKISWSLSISGTKYFFQKMFSISPSIGWEFFLGGDWNSSVFLNALDAFLGRCVKHHSMVSAPHSTDAAHSHELFEVLIEIIDRTNFQNYSQGKYSDINRTVFFDAPKLSRILSKLFYFEPIA